MNEPPTVSSAQARQENNYRSFTGRPAAPLTAPGLPRPHYHTRSWLTRLRHTAPRPRARPPGAQARGLKSSQEASRKQRQTTPHRLDVCSWHPGAPPSESDIRPEPQGAPWLTALLQPCSFPAGKSTAVPSSPLPQKSPRTPGGVRTDTPGLAGKEAGGSVPSPLDHRQGRGPRGPCGVVAATAALFPPLCTARGAHMALSVSLMPRKGEEQEPGQPRAWRSGRASRKR